MEFKKMLESIVGSIHGKKIYKNPSSSDLHELALADGKEVRFMAIESLKAVYVFSESYLHVQVCHKVPELQEYSGVVSRGITPPNIFSGNGILHGSKIMVLHCDMNNSEERAKCNWSFADKYFLKTIQTMIKSA